MIKIKYLTKLQNVLVLMNRHVLCLNSPWVQQLHHDQMLPHYQVIPK